MLPSLIHGFGLSTIRIDQIVRLEASRNYTYIFFKNGTKLLTANTMAHYEATFPAYFIRVHRSHYININEIKTLGNQVVLNDGKRIPVSRRKRRQTIEAVVNLSISNEISITNEY